MFWFRVVSIQSRNLGTFGTGKRSRGNALCKTCFYFLDHNYGHSRQCSIRNAPSFAPDDPKFTSFKGTVSFQDEYDNRIGTFLTMITRSYSSASKPEASATMKVTKMGMSGKARIPFVIQRGGTSKGIFFHKEDLPKCEELRDIVIQDAFGSPDVRQIDGLGGADVLTSKVAIVSKRMDSSGCTDNVLADVDYLFGQVEFGRPSSSPSDATNLVRKRILYDVNCGNISAGVGPYAIEEGLIEVNDDTVAAIDIGSNDSNGIRCPAYRQTVRIYNVNTGKVIIAEVPVTKVLEKDEADGCGDSWNDWTVVEEGGYEIDGVPGASAYLPLDFSNCVGTLTASDGSSNSQTADTRDQGSSRLLPTGNVRDAVVVDGQSYDVSLLDVANFVVHVDGRQLGLTGKEPSLEILKNSKFWNTVRRIRFEAAKLVMEEDEITLTKPFTAVVFPYLPDHGYESIRGDLICDAVDQEKDEPPSGENHDGRTNHAGIDFRSFVLFCDHPHKAYPGTASNATAAAALIDGTVVNDVLNNPIETTTLEPNKRTREKIVTIGHPSGRMEVSSRIKETLGDVHGAIEPIDRDDGKSHNSSKEYFLERSVIGRTFRRLADGFLYLKPDTVRRWKEAKTE